MQTHERIRRFVLLSPVASLPLASASEQRQRWATVVDLGARRKLRREIAAIVAGGALVAFGSSFLFIRGCDLAHLVCSDEQVAKYPSPSGLFEARVYVRDCGATTSWATHVTMTRKQKFFPDITTLVFVADGNHGAAPLGPANGPEVRLRWQDENTLVVDHHKAARVFRSAPSFDRVGIVYGVFK